MPSYPLLLIWTAVLLTFSLSALSLSACQPMSTEAEPDLSHRRCQLQELPFSYSVCRVDSEALASKSTSLQLFWQQPNRRQPLLTFDALLAALPADQTLSVAMNAGMYNAQYAPIGYTVIEGQEYRALNLKTGGGNFHLLPNGVLWWDKSGTVHITESNALSTQLKTDEVTPWYATQSGPMLVIEDKIHPKFNPNSTSLKIRNGVGVCSDGSIQLVKSETPVSFYQFAALFKNDLGCPNALFLDGGIASALYAPSIDKHDKKEMGVMIGLIDTKTQKTP